MNNQALVILQQQVDHLEPDPHCQYCHGSGLMDSGGTTPWDQYIEVRCYCTFPDAQA
jgi:hypothetical protein